MISFAHSFWTKPLLSNKFAKLQTALAINLVEYALSVEFVHSNGYKIKLYTDKEGAEIFGKIPYDDIVILENTITDNYHFAASFKFVALEHMTLNEVLIDGDIFLHKTPVYKIIENDVADMLVSMFEPKEYIENDKERNTKMLEMLRNCNFAEPYTTPTFDDCDGWYNTSLMKFGNEVLKDEYIKQYKLHNSIVKDVDFQNTWPDIILEQRHLTQLSRYKNYKIHTIIEDFPSVECDHRAVEIGFMHLGNAKYSTQMQNIQTLYAMNPKVCIELNSHINNMIAKYSNK